MATIQKVLTIGSTPVLALTGNGTRRRGWRVTYISSAKIAGNTGRVHLGRNYAPNTTLGDPNSGDAITQSEERTEAKRFNDDHVFGGDIWLVATIATQQLEVEETLED